MPSSSWRRVHFGGRPGRLPRGSSGSRIRHCRSVRSLRAPMDRLANEVSGQMTIFLGEDPSTGALLHVPARTRATAREVDHLPEPIPRAGLLEQLLVSAVARSAKTYSITSRVSA